jgi:hypothetical protein
MIHSSVSSATVIARSINIDVAQQPFTIDIGGPTYSFSGTGDFFDSIAVTTSGAARVGALGAPFYDPPRPATYFTDDRAPFVDGSLLAQFLPFTTPAAIPFSVVDTIIALSFDLTDGLHYGYAYVAGMSLVGYGYESTPGVGIQAGVPRAVPTPGSAALLMFGLSLPIARTFARRVRRAR